MFDQDLLEQRSPQTYSLWYMASSPWRCLDCYRPVTTFWSETHIIEHNLHSIGKFQSHNVRATDRIVAGLARRNVAEP
jgi:hypothetical protein